MVGLLGAMLIAALVDYLPGFDTADRLSFIASGIILSLPFTIAAALWAAREKKVLATKSKKQSGALRLILENAPLRLLLITNLCLGISSGVSAGMFLFYAEDVLKIGSWASFSLIPLTFSGLLFLPLMMALCRRVEKHRALCYAALYNIATSLLYLFIPAGNVVMACLVFTVMGATMAVNTFIPQAIMADIADLDAVRSGAKRTGLQISLLNTTTKISSALAIGISYPLLSLIGFDPSPEANNSEETLSHFRWLMCFLPIAMYSLAVSMMWRFPLNRAAQEKLQREIKAGANDKAPVMTNEISVGVGSNAG